MRVKTCYADPVPEWSPRGHGATLGIRRVETRQRARRRFIDLCEERELWHPKRPVTLPVTRALSAQQCSITTQAQCAPLTFGTPQQTAPRVPLKAFFQLGDP